MQNDDHRTQAMQSAFDEVAGVKVQWTMAVLGAWAVDGDGIFTNGGGTVGAVAAGTEQAAAYCKVEDDGSFANLAVSGAEAGYTANYQLFPDTPVAETDYVYFGANTPFCEIGLDLSATPATYDAAGVLEWFYWNGSAWAALTIAHDNTHASTKDGTLSFARDGALQFIPPTGWARSEVDSQAGHWIRCGIASGKAANMTQVPITNSAEHSVVEPTNGFLCPEDGTVTGLRLSDGASTLHTTADVKFILMNYTTGIASSEMTFAQDVRNQTFTGLSLPVSKGDELGVLVTQEDGSAEPADVILVLDVTLTA